VADAGIKKAVVSKDDLPPVTSGNSYRVRFRIISEDRNRTSHWSPIVEVLANAPDPVEGRVLYANDVVNVVWEDESNFPNYDVFVSFDSQDFFYHGTTSVHNYSFIGNFTERVDVVIQISGSEKILSSSLSIFSGFFLIDLDTSDTIVI
jgi:hypothetical protein